MLVLLVSMIQAERREEGKKTEIMLVILEEEALNERQESVSIL